MCIRDSVYIVTRKAQAHQYQSPKYQKIYLQFLRINLLAIAPDSFQIVEQTVLSVEYMYDNITKVQQYPASKTVAFTLFNFVPCFSKCLFYIVNQCSYLSLIHI